MWDEGKREGDEGGEGVTVTLEINPPHATRDGTAATVPEAATPRARTRWNKLKHASRASRTFRNGGKQRMKRLSKVMKARQNESGGAVSMHVDAKSGRRYSYDPATGQTQWLADKDEEDEATQGETKNNSTKRKSFRKIVGGEENDYFVNVETGEAVWYVPEDGEEVSW